MNEAQPDKPLLPQKKIKLTKKQLVIGFTVLGVLIVGTAAVLLVGGKNDGGNQKASTDTHSNSSVVDQIKQKWPNDVIDIQSFDCAPRNDDEWYRTDHTLVIDPKDPDTMLVNIEWLGLYKTTDGGKTWAHKTKGVKAYARRDDPSKACYGEYPTMAIDPHNTKHIMLVASGGGGGFLSLTEPNAQTGGAFHSFDGGETWDFMITENMNIYATDATFDPKTPGTAYYATSSNPASHTEADQSKTFVTKGLIYKTTDNGKSWSELPTGIGQNSSVTKIIINPANPAEMVAPTFSAQRQSADGTGTGIATGKKLTEQLGILRTADGGQTWAPIAGSSTNAIVNAAYSKHVFGHMFFTPFTGENVQPFGLVTTDGVNLKQTKYLETVAYNPHDTSGRHMLGYSSLSVGPASQNLTLHESRDGGVTWAKYGTLPKEITDPNNRKTRVSSIVWHPTEPQTIFMAGAGGLVWKSTDNGKTWQTLLNYEIAQKS